jgi:hypothetical protein
MILYRRKDGSGGCCVIRGGEEPPSFLDPRSWQPEPNPIDPMHPPYGFNTLVAQEAITAIGFYMFEGRRKSVPALTPRQPGPFPN